MKSFVLMLQTDEDYIYITSSTLTEISNKVPVEYAATFEEMEALVKSNGHPSVILLSDRGAVHSSNAMLRKLKTHGEYSHIPVVVLGESSTPDYIRECYRAGANSYITKPSNVESTRKKIELFFSYWFEVAETAD